ncbi:MAG: MarR family transcriptional regulator [Bacteroidota bacterium]
MQDKKLQDVIYFWIHRANSRSKDYSKKVIKEAGIDITVDQWVLLKQIGERPGLSQVELANATFKDPAAILRIVQILLRKELVKRSARPDDKRTNELFLTEQGQTLVNRLIPLIQGVRAVGLEGLSAEDAESIKKWMKKIFQNFDQKIEEAVR